MTEQSGSSRFYLLGPLEVRSGGEPVAVRSGRERALLATLLLRANRLVTVDEQEALELFTELKAPHAKRVRERLDALADGAIP